MEDKEATRTIWTRAAREIPWKPMTADESNLLLDKNFKAEVKRQQEMLEMEREKWKDESVEELRKIPLSEALESLKEKSGGGLNIIHKEAGGRDLPVILWRNPNHPYSSSAPLFKDNVKITRLPQHVPEESPYGQKKQGEKKEEEWDGSASMVFVSGGYVGNELLWRTFNMTDSFPEYVITLDQSGYISHHIHANKRDIDVNIAAWYCGIVAEGGDQIRALSYLMRDLYLLCFPICDQWAFDRMRSKFPLEVMSFCSTVKSSLPPPIILVGVGSELRYSDESPLDAARSCSSFKSAFTNNPAYVTQEECIHLAQTIGAAFYIECSTPTGHGVSELLEEIVRLECWYHWQKGDQSQHHNKRCTLQ